MTTHSSLRYQPSLWIVLLAICLPSIAEASAPPTSPRTGDKMPLTTRSDEVRELYLEGEAYIDSWRLEKSLPIFERIVELEPDFPLGWVGLAWSQSRFKDMFEYADKALALLDAAKVSDAERLRVKAFHASMNSDPAGWQAHTEELVKLYPGDPRALAMLGNVHAFSLNDRQGALEMYRRAVASHPDFVPAWQGIARMEKLLGRREASEKAIRRYLEIAPDDPRAHNMLADHQLEAGHLDAALRGYREALELEPQFESSEQGIVTVWMLQGRHEEARGHLREILGRAPHDGYRSGLHFALAVTHADEGDHRRAAAELQSNLALSAKIHDSLAMAIDLNNLIEVLLAAGRFDEAEQAADQLLRHITEDPAQPEARKQVTRATHLLRQGDVALARGDLEAAKAKASEFESRAEEMGRPWMVRAARQLPGKIALAEGRWDDAIRLLEASNPHSARNMFRIALAYRGKGDDDGYRRMLGYVVDYRGVLNLGYALVRREAEARLAESG